MIFPKTKLAFGFRLSAVTLLTTLLALWAILQPSQALAQEAQVVKILGYAEILSQGTWREVKTGQRLLRGETLRTRRGGEATVTASEGKINLTVKSETTVTYDGLVDTKSRPWKDGVPFKPVSIENIPESERSPQFSVPEGEAEVVVVPGQPLRVVTPLILAAVRGTTFIVSVAADGSSALTTIEGQVLGIARTGAAQMIGPGAGMQVSSSQYAAFLQESGLNVPSGDWQQVDLSSLERVDAQTFGDAVSPSAAPETAPTSATSGAAPESAPTTSTATGAAPEAAPASPASAPSATSTAAPSGTAPAGTAPGGAAPAGTSATSGATTSGAASAGTTGATAGTGAAGTTAGTASAATSGATGAAASSAAASSAATGAAAATTSAAAATTTAASALTSALAQIAPVVGSVGAVGAAGVATGVVTGEAVQQAIEAEEATSSSAPVSGNIIILDPLTHQPQGNFVTDENGELTVEVIAPPGESVLEVSIGGEVILVDLNQGGTTLNYEVAFDNYNFTTAASGYKSTATLTPDFGGLTPTGPVAWSVTVISNPPPDIWNNGPSDLNGLTWGPTPASATGWVNAVRGTAPTGATAQLTDVVGSRTVRVDVSTVINSATVTDSMYVTFGPGPLSPLIFPEVMRMWYVYSTWPDIVTHNNDPASFPFASDCSGQLPDFSDISGLPGAAVYGASWTTEIVNGSTVGRPLNTKMPSIEQITAIAPPSSYNPNAKGALLAAGWSQTLLMTSGLRYTPSEQNFDLVLFQTNNGTIYITSCTNCALVTYSVTSVCLR